MNISYPIPKTVPYKEIKAGEVFGYAGELYIQLEEPLISPNDALDCANGEFVIFYSAVRLRDGFPEEFDDNTRVEKVTTYTRAEYDREE